VSELIRVLADPKFRLQAHEQEELLADYLPHALAVRIPQPPPAMPRCRDPSDLPFLQLAGAGKADALVSDDGDVLALAQDTLLGVLGIEACVADLQVNY
jgi:predicted nucleic acid-binding protein